MGCPRCGVENPTAATRCGGCGGPLKPVARDPLVGRELGNFRLIEKMGAGGMGSVYVAEHVNLQTRYAVKLMHPVFVSDPTLSERFRREAVTASGIRHDNVVFIADFGWDDELGFYIAMELLEGLTLGEALANGEPFAPDRIWRIVRQIGWALNAAHKRGVIHRDLKPSNVFLTPGDEGEERVKVLDFGIAKVFAEGGDDGLTTTGDTLGSPKYMAPEQAEGLVQEIGPWTDLYSFGIIVFQLLTGRTPFSAPTRQQLLIQHMEAAPPPVSKWRPDLEGTVIEDLLLRMLAKRPADRPDSVPRVTAAMETGLREIDEGVSAPVVAEEPGPVGAAASSPGLTTGSSHSGHLQTGTRSLAARARGRSSRLVKLLAAAAVLAVLSIGGAALYLELRTLPQTGSSGAPLLGSSRGSGSVADSGEAKTRDSSGSTDVPDGRVVGSGFGVRRCRSNPESRVCQERRRSQTPGAPPLGQGRRFPPARGSASPGERSIAEPGGRHEPTA